MSDPSEGGTQEGQSLACSSWALQQSVLPFIESLHDSVHEFYLAVVWLKWKVNIDSGNADGWLKMHDFLVFH